MPKSFDFHHAPAHLIRRAHQLSVAIFMEEAGDFAVTPVQFAILNALIDDPGEDQVIGRLEAKGWVRREPDEGDRRRKRLWVTTTGQQAAAQMKRAVGKVQRRLVGPLNEAERHQLVVLLGKLVKGHEAC
jgi:hypothetical protein